MTDEPKNHIGQWSEWQAIGRALADIETRLYAITTTPGDASKLAEKADAALTVIGVLRERWQSMPDEIEPKRPAEVVSMANSGGHHVKTFQPVRSDHPARGVPPKETIAMTTPSDYSTWPRTDLEARKQGIDDAIKIITGLALSEFDDLSGYALDAINVRLHEERSVLAGRVPGAPPVKVVSIR